MTIDSKFTVRATKPRSNKSFTPPSSIFGLILSETTRLIERLFLCPKLNFGTKIESVFCSGNDVFDNAFWRTTPKRNGLSVSRLYKVWLDKKLPKCLAFKAKIYYNNVLYVVGPRFMQEVAKLRKVAEVFITDFNYLVVPHIANSKRTIVAK